MWPIFYQNSYFSVTALGVLGALGFMLGIFWLTKLVMRRQLDLQFVVDHFWSLFLGGALGARLEVVLVEWEVVGSSVVGAWEEIFKGWSGVVGGVWRMIDALFLLGGWGLAGGVLGFGVVLWWWCRRRKEVFLRWLDVFTLAALGAFAVAYVGMFLDGSGYGEPTDLPWGVSFENVAVPYTIPIHPVQLYVVLAALVAGGVGYMMFRNKFKEGGVALFAGGGFLLVKFWIDFLRGDVKMFFRGLSLGQWLILLILVMMLGVVLVSRFLRKRK